MGTAGGVVSSVIVIESETLFPARSVAMTSNVLFPSSRVIPKEKVLVSVLITADIAFIVMELRFSSIY